MNAVCSNPNAAPDVSAWRHDLHSLQATLAEWTHLGWLRPLDTVFARFLCQEVPEASPLLALAAALASHQLGRGHACLDLQAMVADPASVFSEVPDGLEDADTSWPTPLVACAQVDRPGWLAALAHTALVASGSGSTPLVLDGTRLYLRRYWHYENQIADAINQRLATSARRRSELPTKQVRQVLDVLFDGQKQAVTPDWQKLACALAAQSSFAVMTGGPGTGKTTTVLKLLALLQAVALHPEQAHGRAPRALRIALAAPTGKAAARLSESIAKAVSGLMLDTLPDANAIRAAIPTTVRTLHRVLGTIPESGKFRHDANNTLPVDVLVIDEASMIDLDMMASIFSALPSNASLILLGDRDQLASVEAGTVLSQLCERAQDGHYTPDTRDWLFAATGEVVDEEMIDPQGQPHDQAIVMLRHNHRFATDGAIARLASAIKHGDAINTQRILRTPDTALAWIDPIAHRAAFDALVLDGGSASTAEPTRQGYRHYLTVMKARQPAADATPDVIDTWAKSVLEAHASFQVLCVHRRGKWGLEKLNEAIACLLQKAGLIPAHEGWYAGRPVIVTRNDYTLNLMNGDIGITFAMPDRGGKTSLHVAFLDGESRIKWVSASRLQEVDTVFALTVHKAQGSEFSHTALVLPDAVSALLTRELLYTGVTRTAKHFTLVTAGDGTVLAEGVRCRIARAGGLLAPRT
jgi:exodeoxyribonuclease V alpha subunit